VVIRSRAFPGLNHLRCHPKFQSDSKVIASDSLRRHFRIDEWYQQRFLDKDMIQLELFSIKVQWNCVTFLKSQPLSDRLDIDFASPAFKVASPGALVVMFPEDGGCAELVIFQKVSEITSFLIGAS
jgi:hypothetical protein